MQKTEVIKYIKKLATKSCDLDSIPTKLLKEIIDVLITPITELINLSLRVYVFPLWWKTSIVRPLLKKTVLELIPSNYRPVINLSFLLKVLEKAALHQIDIHNYKWRLLFGCQSAYRARYSCETALAKLMNDILWKIEHKKITLICSLDLSAAFDTVDHSVLLEVLNKRFGMGGMVNNWFASYLSPRFCKISIQDAYSTPRELIFSVPQGSIVGPSLYTYHACTLQDVIPSDIGIHGYADDHGIKID